MFSLKMIKGAELAEGVQTEMSVPSAFTRFTIGRDPGNHWPVPDATRAISARHCEIVPRPDGGVALRDLSTNGTFVNASPSRISGEHRLQDGDRIELGPYTIQVLGPVPRGAVVAPPEPARAPAVPVQRVPSVEATAPLRGGDPAAMLSGSAPARVGLTEILRAAPPADDSSEEVTKIRVAPKAAAGGAAPQRPTAAAPAMPMPVQAASAAPVQSTASAPAAMAATGPVDPLLAALAGGLGLPDEALAGRDAAQAAAQVGALAQAAITALRQLLEQQAQARRQIGSRAPALGAVRDVNPLRLAATPQAALQALLAPGIDGPAALQRAGAELAAHQGRLLAAFGTAASRLGQDIAPASLQSALAGGAGAQQPAQLWALYTQVWQGLGLAPGQPWSQGFQEAALMHLAAAYDAQEAQA